MLGERNTRAAVEASQPYKRKLPPFHRDAAEKIYVEYAREIYVCNEYALLFFFPPFCRKNFRSQIFMTAYVRTIYARLVRPNAVPSLSSSVAPARVPRFLCELRHGSHIDVHFREDVHLLGKIYAVYSRHPRADIGDATTGQCAAALYSEGNINAKMDVASVLNSR